MKPIIHVAPFKWVNYTLKFAYYIGKFYLNLAEAVHTQAATRVNTEEAYPMSDRAMDFYDSLHKPQIEVNVGDTKTNWDSVLRS